MKTRAQTLVALVTAASALAGCGNDFDPQSDLDSVRILATRADRPYAKPGDTVTVEVLAYDARPTKPAAMEVSWVPTPCVNPSGGAYYDCYPAFASQFERGVDLTSELTAGSSLTVSVPTDALAGQPSEGGQPASGTVMVFGMACAGHVEYLGAGPSSSPEAVPFGCYDADHRLLGPDAFVFAFATVFVFADRENANPVIDGLTFDGQAVDPSAGITMPACTSASKCPSLPLDTRVPASSQEPDPGATMPNGVVPKEEVWVDYYLTAGQVKDDLRLLYDPTVGAVSDSTDDVTAPSAAAEGVLFAVVHDNRGGVAWVQVPLHIQ